MLPLSGVFNQQTIYVAPTPNFFWPMQEGTGTTFTDIVSSVVATTVGAATWSTTTGRSSNTCLVLAAGPFAYAPDPFYYDPMTICAWIYPTTINTQKCILVKRNDSGGLNLAASPEFELGLNATNKLYFWRWDSIFAQVLNVVGATTVPQNTWSFVGASSNGVGGTGYVYYNGAIDGSAVQTTIGMNGNATFQFGGRSSNLDARIFFGRMQEVRVFDQQLTQDEMTAIYNTATP